jgi:hypothetical protein
VDVAAVVVEDRSLVRVREALSCAAVEPERFGNAVRFFLGVAFEVDPEQLSPAQPPRPVVDVVEPLDLIAVEENCLAHGRARTPQSRFGTSTIVCES